MKIITLNFDWTRTIGSRWLRLPAEKVNLPEDYILAMERRADNPSGGSVGFFRRRMLSIPENWRLTAHFEEHCCSIWMENMKRQKFFWMKIWCNTIPMGIPACSAI